jgi:hypothetical protein
MYGPAFMIGTSRTLANRAIAAFGHVQSVHLGNVAQVLKGNQR